MICMCNINSGQKRFDGVPAKSAADSVSQGGFPLEHQNLKGAKPAGCLRGVVPCVPLDMY